MSLEDAIRDLIVALEANTAALGGAAPAEAKPAETKPAETKTTKAKATKAKATTAETVAKAFGAYLAEEGDGAKAVLRKINAHFGVKRVTEVDPTRFDEALELLERFRNGEDPFDAEDGI